MERYYSERYRNDLIQVEEGVNETSCFEIYNNEYDSSNLLIRASTSLRLPPTDCFFLILLLSLSLLEFSMSQRKDIKPICSQLKSILNSNQVREVSAL